MYNDHAELLAVSAEKIADRKGLDWLIDYAVSAMEEQHRRQMSEMHVLVKKMGDALLVSHVAISYHPGGNTLSPADHEACADAVLAYNDYRADY